MPRLERRLPKIEAGGEIASALATKETYHLVRRTLRNDNIVWPYPADLSRAPDENLVAFATRLADDSIIEQRVGELAKMGSTLSMFLGFEHRAVIGHVGDSRIYRLRDESLEQLTADHTLYAQLVDKDQTA